MRVARRESSGLMVLLFILVLCGDFSVAQRRSSPDEVPSNFTLDKETAARMRPKLIAQSVAATGHYEVGRLVLARLVAQLRMPENVKPAWELRIIEDKQLNAFSSPDGTLYVESGVAELAGASTGLWAALLSHEIAHVVRRDWARRYLYQRYLENGGGAPIVLGDPALPSSSWDDSERASEEMGRFCRQMELAADRESLMLMARAGYHPDFVPALHHLLHARGTDAPKASLYAMHPCWEERDRELSRAYEAASIEFGRIWPEWYASPGGNPPIVVFAEEPSVHKTGPGQWELRVPMRCQNLAGAVEVVVHSGSKKTWLPELSVDRSESADDLHELTGCTSPRTTVTFALGDSGDRKPSQRRWSDVYVLDAWGSVLARTDVPKLH